VEGDVKTVAYGGMLLEGVVALLALATLMMLPKGDTLLKSDPNIVYATGLATYMGRVGIGFNLALTFALVAFATFVYDTLDVCTRLARYILQELLGWKSRAGAVGCTALTLLPALAFLMMAREKAYALAWPTFGTSNQLMASLTLLGLSVWLLNAGRRAWYVLAPLAFILAATMTSLVLLVLPFYRKISGAAAGAIPPDTAIAGVVGSILLLLSAWLVISSLKTMLKKSAA
jgi:carbon starvation protein